jgi:hypothetical protein
MTRDVPQSSRALTKCGASSIHNQTTPGVVTTGLLLPVFPSRGLNRTQSAPVNMASNPGSRSTSYTERKNNSRQARKSGATSSTVERQTEKKKILVRETYTIRSTSPPKRQSDAQEAPKRAREAAATNPKREAEKDQPGTGIAECLICLYLADAFCSEMESARVHHSAH